MEMCESDRASEINYAKEEGIEEGSKQVAKKMKEKNIDTETIIETTGLTREEIEKL